MDPYLNLGLPQQQEPSTNTNKNSAQDPSAQRGKGSSKGSGTEYQSSKAKQGADADTISLHPMAKPKVYVPKTGPTPYKMDLGEDED